MAIPGIKSLVSGFDSLPAVAGRLGLPFLSAMFLSWAVVPTLVAADNLEDVRLRLVNGSSIRATIRSIAEDGTIAGSGMLEDVKLEEVTSISTGRPVTESQSLPIVRLDSGSLIPFSGIVVNRDSAEVTCGEQQRSFPLELVRAIVWKQGSNVESVLANPPTDEDSVIVETTRGDRTVGGLLESIDATHVNMLYQGKSRKILIDKVKAVITAKLALNPPAGTVASIRLVDGAVIVGAIKSYRDDVISVALSDQHELSVAAGNVSSISIRTDRIAWLSDLNPIRTEQQTQFVAARDWQRDRSLLGNPLRLKFNSSTRIHEFDKGIGTRSFTSIVFGNDNNYSQFRAVVGIDVETDGHGDCVMVVEGDGIRLWSQRVRATDDPLPIVVDITGIREIALIVLPGEDFDLADHADWADARFTRID
jgi:small nuclear ribonucleoprotein (snRNP)-like protein